ncbi:MAG: hypothetical protein JWL61_5300 [Gemmatimonadetes bacterium]|nr:hypothetical protein [Gemmatimonadota bacterium]
MSAAPKLELHRDPEPKHPDDELMDQVCDALNLVDRSAKDFLNWPFRELAALTGGMAKGDVWFVCAFSGNGKTTFLSSAIDEWYTQGKKVYVMPLETRPKVFRTYWACQRLGINPGEVLSGALEGHPQGSAMRTAIRTELHMQTEGRMRDLVRVNPVNAVNVPRLTRAVQEAHDWGADVIIVDHIDQIAGGDGSNLYAESRKVNGAVLDLAQDYEQKLLCSSQLNNGAMVGGRDKLARYGPPEPNHVFMGGHKRHIATGMIGLHRKLRERRQDEDPKEYKAALHEARIGDAEVRTALEPGVMGATAMKLRNYGERDGQRVYMALENGRVSSIDERDKHGTSYQELARL